jgi:hypothetical protein
VSIGYAASGSLGQELQGPGIVQIVSDSLEVQSVFANLAEQRILGRHLGRRYECDQAWLRPGVRTSGGQVRQELGGGLAVGIDLMRGPQERHESLDKLGGLVQPIERRQPGRQLQFRKRKRATAEGWFIERFERVELSLEPFALRWNSQS